MFEASIQYKSNTNRTSFQQDQSVIPLQTDSEREILIGDF